MLKHYYEHWLVYSNMNSNVRYSQHDTPWTSVIFIGWPVSSPGCRFPIYGIPLGKPTLLRWLSSRSSWLPKRWSWRKRAADAFIFSESPIFPNFIWLYYALQWVIGLILLRSSGNFPSCRDWATRIRSTVSSSWKRALPDDCRLLTSRLQRSTRRSLRGLGGWGLVAGWWHKLCPNRKGDFKKNHYFSWGLDGDFHQETPWISPSHGQLTWGFKFREARIFHQAWHGDLANQFTGVWKT